MSISRRAAVVRCDVLLIVGRLISGRLLNSLSMMVTDVYARNLRKERLAKGLSQEALADKAGLHRTYVGSVERGERNITLVNAEKLAHALDIELADLVRRKR